MFHGKPPENNTRRLFLSLLIVIGVVLLASSVLAVNPYTKSKDSWITLSGTVDRVNPHSFLLDYGKGMIIVEMDDWDRDADGYKLLKGDKVTVNGIIDDDLFETRTIEAGSVYVEKLNTYFFASPMDEEITFVTFAAPVVVSETVVQGTVSSVGEQEFIVNTGLRAITVEVDEMPYNPLDEEGYTKIERGDVVRATGTMVNDLFQGRELKADSVIELID